MVGLKRLIRNDYRFTQIDLPVDEYIEDNTKSFRDFFEEYVIIDATSWCSTDDIIAAYQNYSDTRNLPTISDSKVHDILKQDTRLTQKRRMINNVQKRGYDGVRIQETL